MGRNNSEVNMSTEHDSEFFKTMFAKPLSYAVTYHGPGYYNPPGRTTVPVWTVELLDDKDQGTDIKYEVWTENGLFYTPYGADTFLTHRTLGEALQEAFLNLLKYSGMDE
jgi:hypothetical protein